MAAQQAPSYTALDAELNTAAYEQAQVYKLAEEDMDFLAGLALPHITEYAFPDLFITLWQMLLAFVAKSRDFTKIAIGLPRGFGKTSVIKLFILYCILYTNRQFILVFGPTATHAQNIISDVADMLDESNIKIVYGDWRIGIEKDTQEVKKFSFRGRSIILAALGQGGSVRGLNIKNSRPDIMIFDDIQSAADADSPVVSAGIEKWMIGTAMKAASHKGCLYIFIANMYATDWSLLKRLKKNTEWIKFIAGGILSTGESLWEALKPLEQLLAEFRNDLNSGHPEIFYSEVLNDENASVNQNIDLSHIPAYPYLEDEITAGEFIIIDPSNDKVNSDAVTISRFQIIEGKPVAREIKDGIFSPGDTIKYALQMAIQNGITLILIEGNAYQYSLCYWFGHFQKQLGLHYINALPIYSGARSKNSRILDLFKSLKAGEILIHPNCMAQVAHQIIHFNALKANNTDGILDCLCYATRVLTEFPHFIAINNPLGEFAGNMPAALEVYENCLF
jgi:hypothetical protein